MSVRIMSQVFEMSKTEGNARLVLLALADCANDEGACWPSISSVARKANLSDPIAKKYLLSLAAIGLLSKEDRFASDGRQTSNFYQIDVNMIGKDFLSKEAIASVTPPSRKKEWVGVTAVNDTPHNQDDSEVGVTAVRLSYMNHQSEPSSEPPTMSVSEKKPTMVEAEMFSPDVDISHLNPQQPLAGEAEPKAQSIVHTVAASRTLRATPTSKSAVEAHNVSVELMREWNATCLPTIKGMTGQRKKLVASALRIDGFREKWREAVAFCAADEFYNGTGKRSAAHANWRFTVDNFLTDRFFIKILEKLDTKEAESSEMAEFTRNMKSYLG